MKRMLSAIIAVSLLLAAIPNSVLAETKHMDVFCTDAFVGGYTAAEIISAGETPESACAILTGLLLMDYYLTTGDENLMDYVGLGCRMTCTKDGVFSALYQNVFTNRILSITYAPEISYATYSIVETAWDQTLDTLTASLEAAGENKYYVFSSETLDTSINVITSYVLNK